MHFQGDIFSVEKFDLGHDIRSFSSNLFCKSEIASRRPAFFLKNWRRDTGKKNNYFENTPGGGNSVSTYTRQLNE
jgi:hypothetical protein